MDTSKINKTFDYVNIFVENCSNATMKQFVNIFSPMFFRENNYRIDVKVGKRESKERFASFLNNFTDKFNVIPSLCDNEPQLLIKDMSRRKTYAILIINLFLIGNLHITKTESNEYYFHKIDFTYNNQVDYQIDLVVDKE